MLKTLRERGFKVVVFEAGNDTGGTWRFNCYPGARVDSAVPLYEFSWPEVYKTWNWTTNYPDYKELRAYFDHVDKVVGIKKDCSFNTVVTGANFDKESAKWIVTTADGRTSRAKFLILGSGFVGRLSSSSACFVARNAHARDTILCEALDPQWKVSRDKSSPREHCEKDDALTWTPHPGREAIHPRMAGHREVPGRDPPLLLLAGRSR